MIKVEFHPELLTDTLKAEWEDWQKEAAAATEAVIDAWEAWRAKGSPGEFKYKFEEEIWGRLKDWLLENVFLNKCAYCETREVRSHYHAEHFRPKGKVTVKVQGKTKAKQQVVKAVDELGQTIKHPGYFWLAYTWSNLLPSCTFCNTDKGKKNQFPIAPEKTHVSVRLLTALEAGTLQKDEIKSKLPARAGIYYLQPDDLTVMEDPLLLHPYLNDPYEHLVFGEFGVVTPRDGSEKGKHSIEVFNLDSGPLTDARQQAQDAALQDYSQEISRGKKLSNQARINAARAVIEGYIKGEEPYSAAVLANLTAIFPTHGLPSAPLVRKVPKVD